MVSFFFSFLTSFSVLAAESSSIYINEVQIEPIQQVELINNGSSPIDISGWYIDDDGGSTYFTINDGTTIEPNSCIVIDGKFNLNKTSTDTIRLFDNASPPTNSQSQLIDSFTYDTSPGDSKSFQRIPDGTNNWATATDSLGKWNESLADCQPLPSPTSTMTLVPTPTQTPAPTVVPITNIRISEAYVYPDSGDNEWIELYNPNDFPVNLQNWYIDDEADSGSSPKKISISLPAKGYGVYELPTGIYNNRGDSVRLLDSSNQMIDSFSYINATKGLSIGRAQILTHTICEQEPTKGYENETCISKELESTNTPVPSPTVIVSSMTPSQELKSEDIETRYFINSTFPTLTTSQDADILGTDDHIDFSNNTSDQKSFGFLPEVYSLLSIISLAVKIKLK